MTAAALSLLLATAPCVVHFTKKDGTPRRMLTVPTEGGVVVRQGHVTVFDAEKGAYRRVNPATVTEIVQLRAKAHEGRPPVKRSAAVAAPKPERAKTAAEHAADIFG